MNEREFNEWLKTRSKAVQDRNLSDDPRPWKYSVIQEHKEPIQESKDGKDIHRDEPKEKGMDGKSHPQYRVTITWLISDRRKRDSWGMSETIADCVVSASRRFLGLDDTRSPRRKACK